MNWLDKLTEAKRRLSEAHQYLYSAEQMEKSLAQELDDFERLLEIAEDYRELHSCAGRVDDYYGRQTVHTGCSKRCDELDRLLGRYGRGRAKKKEGKK